MVFLGGSVTNAASRGKLAHMDFSIDDALVENITVDYEIGDIIYDSPGLAYVLPSVRHFNHFQTIPKHRKNNRPV